MPLGMVSLMRMFGQDVGRKYIQGAMQGRWYPKNHGTIRNTFWLRHEHEIIDLWRKAREVYREKAKRIHPDVGGDHDTWTWWNQCWMRMTTIIRNRGHDI